ncbi:MAG: beta-ketoacyl-[acyl-carrier-protein] synthase family protein [Saccharofermentans sp.]|nr:beta-ketoacyl-[acyl-carrier-protein] synthase family protein [Saccharofermentans sp.]
MSDIIKRCVVTGLGLVCALGDDAASCAASAFSGKSGIKDVESFDTANCYSHKGAEVALTDEQLCSEKYDRTTLLCIKAAGEALADSGIDLGNEDRTKIGVILGTCIGGAASIDKYYTDSFEGRPAEKEDIKRMPASAIANNVASHFGLDGITANIVNACAAGTMSLAGACDMIRAGKADVFVAGGCDSFSSLAYAGFHALHALSEDACSPFNHSNGITIGEGSGVLIIESYEHAAARGAKIYCDVLGAGVSSDAYHITAPRPDGEGQMSAIRRAAFNSGVDLSEIDYINAHGTGTSKNDEAEFLSLRTLFGNRPDLAVSSTKSMNGHCLGAAGSIEAVLTIEAINRGEVPPTTGYSSDDIEALREKSGGIGFVANDKQAKDVKLAMSNSFAFGGNNASIIFSKEPREIKDVRNTDPIYITGIGEVTGTKAEGASDFRADVSPEVFKQHEVKTAFLRKLDRFSELVLLSGIVALEDAGIKVDDTNADDIGIVIGTSDGPITEIVNFQKLVIEKGIENGSAFMFPNTVYNAAGGYLSIFTGIKGYNITVANGFQAGLQSVMCACEAIRRGDENVMLANGTDELTDIEAELYKNLGFTGNGKDTGAVLGEGSVTLILESSKAAAERGSKKYAQVAGYSIARHSAPYDEIGGTDEALVRAIEEAVSDAGIRAGDIKTVYGFANGIKSLDDVLDRAVSRIWKDGIEVKNVRSESGEARAASAALSLVKAAKEMDASEGDYSIAVSFGAGGIYSAIVLKKA